MGAMKASAGLVGFVATTSGGLTATTITPGFVTVKGLTALNAVAATVVTVNRLITNDFGDAGSRGDNFLMIHNAGPGGICLDASERNKDGGKVHMWTCDRGNHSQRQPEVADWDPRESRPVPSRSSARSAVLGEPRA